MAETWLPFVPARQHILTPSTLYPAKGFPFQNEDSTYPYFDKQSDSWVFDPLPCEHNSLYCFCDSPRQLLPTEFQHIFYAKKPFINKKGKLVHRRVRITRHSLSRSLFSTEARRLTTPAPHPLVDPNTPVPGSSTQFPLRTAQFTDHDDEAFDDSFAEPEPFAGAQGGVTC
jgi:hypothetical protein